MNLIHFTHKQFEYDPNYSYDHPRHVQRPYHKPKGIWVSDEDNFGWKEWNESEQYSSVDVAYKVTLHKENNVLLMSTPEQLLEFTKQYPPPDPIWQDINYIDWPRVMSEYDGIIITPYLWESRLTYTTNWYDGWDCASGCLWNPVFDIKEVNT